MIQATCTFPGLQVISAQMVHVLGSEPSTCIVRTRRQASHAAQRGSLTFSYGNGQFSFQGCAARRMNEPFRQAGGGHAWVILDRRWQWKNATVSGEYNRRASDGTTVISDWERTPQQLFAILFSAVGETGYDVSLVPGLPRPFVSWRSSRVDLQLAELCDQLGCRISLGLNNQVIVYPIGSGPVPPEQGLSRYKAFYASSELPAALRFVGDPTLYQSKLLLEPIVQDTDGTFKPMEDIAWWPSDPHPWTFSTLGDTERVLAERTAWRYFRIKGQADGTLNPPGFSGTVSDTKQYLPINDTLVEVQSNDLPLSAYVEGRFFAAGLDGINAGEESKDARYPGLFTIDRERGWVIFDRPVTRIDTSGAHVSPDLFLVTSYPLRTETGIYDRFSYDRSLSNGGVGSKDIRRRGVYRTVRATYTGTSVATIADNQSAVVAEANKFLPPLEADFSNLSKGTFHYAGLQSIPTSGATQQVAWFVGDGKSSKTVASLNHEGLWQSASHRERRQQQRTDLAHEGLI